MNSGFQRPATLRFQWTDNPSRNCVAVKLDISVYSSQNVYSCSNVIDSNQNRSSKFTFPASYHIWTDFVMSQTFNVTLLECSNPFSVKIIHKYCHAKAQFRDLFTCDFWASICNFRRLNQENFTRLNSNISLWFINIQWKKPDDNFRNFQSKNEWSMR